MNDKIIEIKIKYIDDPSTITYTESKINALSDAYKGICNKLQENYNRNLGEIIRYAAITGLQ